MPIKVRTPTVGAVYRKITFSDAGLANGILLGLVPAGALITDCRTIVATPFNASGTDFWRVGINAGGFEYSGIDVNVAAAGVISHVDAYSLNPLASDRTVYGRFIGSGNAATAGVLHFVMQYLVGL